jgi:hypothetical protein
MVDHVAQLAQLASQENTRVTPGITTSIIASDRGRRSPPPPLHDQGRSSPPLLIDATITPSGMTITEEGDCHPTATGRASPPPVWALPERLAVLAFSIGKHLSVVLLYGSCGGVTPHLGDFRPGQWVVKRHELKSWEEGPVLTVGTACLGGCGRTYDGGIGRTNYRFPGYR